MGMISTRSEMLILLSVFAIILLSFLYIYSASYAQQTQPNSQTKLKTNTKVISVSQPAQSPATLVHKLPSVKIKSPIRGQQVLVGSNLTISGTSTDNATTNCGVYVIADSIKPYQKTVPMGKGAGANDYSTWIYPLTPKYTTIKKGANEITAKISCAAMPKNLTKFYSINITGVTTSPVVTNNSTNSSPSSIIKLPFT